MNAEAKKPGVIRLFPGMWIVLGVSAALVLCAGWRWLHRPHNLEQLAEQYGSIYLFQKPPVINRAGTLVGSIHTTARGVGVFIADINSRTERQGCEARSMDYMNDLSRYNMDANGVFGWSPDDETFAFLWNYTLYFLAANGEKSGGGPVPNGIRAFAWLSPESCAYIDDAQKLALVKRSNGQWQEQAAWPLPRTNGVPRSLLAVNAETVAWLTDNVLWQMNLSSGEMKPLFSDAQKQLAGASWCGETGSFLLVASVRDRRGRDNKSSLVVVREGGSRSIKDVAGTELLTEAQWINGGKGWASVTARGDNSYLTVKPGVGAGEQKYFSAGRVEKIVCSGENSRVYAFAIKTNEPPGFWRCDLDGGALSYAFAPWGYQDLALNFQPALAAWVPWGDGHSQQITLVPPAHFSRHKKYPLIIALDGYTWIDTGTGTYAQTLANVGAYVAISNYHYNPRRYNLENIHDYTNIVLAIYDQVAASPNVDPSRVFLFGPSFVTYVLSDLARDFPGRFKGIYLCGPSSLPEPKPGMTGRIFATTGEGEHERRFPDYQRQLFKAGIPMEWHLHPDDAHIERAQNTMRRQALLMARMVFEE